jgi:hypothetical protein
VYTTQELRPVRVNQPLAVQFEHPDLRMLEPLRPAVGAGDRVLLPERGKLRARREKGVILLVPLAAPLTGAATVVAAIAAVCVLLTSVAGRTRKVT